MAKKNVIIIGAGLAGLSAGCYACMNGYKPRIFEHHSQPGGVAAAWKRGEYIFDGGIHFLMGHKEGQPLYDMYQQLGVFDSNRVIDMKTYATFIDENSGNAMKITDDMDRLESTFKEISPEDGRVIARLINAVRDIQENVNMASWMDKPPELMGAFGNLLQMWRMRKVMKYFTGRYNKPVAEYTRDFRNPWLRDIINNIFLPDVPVWFVLMVLATLADGQIGLPEGGSWGFVSAIEKRFRALGGEVAYDATVDTIIVEKDKAVGVRLEDGSEYNADIIISAADGYSTIYKMLGKRYINRKIQERYKNWKLFDPIVMVNYGVNRQFPDDTHITHVKLSRPLRVGDDHLDWMWLRIFNYSPRFAPPGKTVIQCTFESRWSYWHDMVERDRGEYENAKKHVAALILEWLETRYPGISNQVEVTDVSTPYTTWRYTRNRYGSFEGFLPTPDVATRPIPRTLPGLKNFYMAGQWVMPGGGVPSVLCSGRHVVQILCHRDGKRFRTDV